MNAWKNIFKKDEFDKKEVVKQELNILLEQNSKCLIFQTSSIDKNLSDYFKRFQLINIVIAGILLSILYFFYSFIGQFNPYLLIILMIVLSLLLIFLNIFSNFFIIYNIIYFEKNKIIISFKDIFLEWTRNLLSFIKLGLYLFFFSVKDTFLAFIASFLIGIAILVIFSGSNSISNVFFIKQYFNFIFYPSLFIWLISFILSWTKYPYVDFILIESIIKKQNKTIVQMIKQNNQIYRIIGAQLFVRYCLQRPFSFWNYKGSTYLYFLYLFILSKITQFDDTKNI